MMLLRRRAHVGDALEQVVLERARAPRQLVGAAQRPAVPRARLAASLALCNNNTHKCRINYRLFIALAVAAATGPALEP